MSDFQGIRKGLTFATFDDGNQPGWAELFEAKGTDWIWDEICPFDNMFMDYAWETTLAAQDALGIVFGL